MKGMSTAVGLALVAVMRVASAWDTPTVRPHFPLIFPDDTQIASRTNVVRAFHPAVKDFRPALVPTFAWESNQCGVYGSVNRLDDGRYRMWYFTAWDKTAIADSTDGGRTWTRVTLGDGALEPGTSIVFKGHHCPAVLYDRFERDPSRRYKGTGAKIFGGEAWGEADKARSGYFSITSPDGMHWTGDRRILRGWDTSSLAQNQETGEIFLYHKIMTPLPGRDEERRFVFVSRTKDFEHWSEPVRALAPDEADDGAWIDEADQRTDFYNMAVFSYAGGFIGFPTIFRITARQPLGKDLKYDPKSALMMDDGAIDVQMATSGDGVTFHRTPGRRTMIAASPEGGEDVQVAGVASGEPVTDGDETSLYYYGINKSHSKVINAVPPVHYRIYRAVWRRWGFASVGTSSHGRFETKPVRLGTDDLRVNLRLERDPRQENPLEAERDVCLTVLSPAGGVLAVSEPMTRDETLARPVWKDGRRPPTNEPVVLRFDLHAASVFAVECL